MAEMDSQRRKRPLITALDPWIKVRKEWPVIEEAPEVGNESGDDEVSYNSSGSELTSSSETRTDSHTSTEGQPKVPNRPTSPYYFWVSESGKNNSRDVWEKVGLSLRMVGLSNGTLEF